MDIQTTLNIPQAILDAARLTPQELKHELGLSLYASGRLSAGKARELAGLSLTEFRTLLAARRIPVHYDVEDLDAELNNLQGFNRL